MASSEDDERQSVRKTISCLLCGGVQIYPGPRYENHLVNEHGAVFDIDYLIQISLYKQQHGTLPKFVDSNESGNKPETKTVENGHLANVQTADTSCQTDSAPAEVKDICNSPTRHPVATKGSSNVQTEHEEEEAPDGRTPSTISSTASSILKRRLEKKKAEAVAAAAAAAAAATETTRAAATSIEENEEADGKIDCWLCPLCPKIYRKHSHFRQHVCIAHEMDQEDIAGMISVRMTEEEFEKQLEAAEKAEEQFSGPVMNSPIQKNGDEVSPGGGSFLCKRKPMSKEWSPNSFSSTFTCYFCNEQFRKDYKLKLHLMLNHRSESAADMAKAKEELTKSKLDGCVHKCAMCGSRYNSVANFTRHVKDMHDISRAQYREEYGSSEIVSRTFKCELCEKEVKHTRNIIGAHMKMVHLISWKEYQEILVKLRLGETVGDLPAPDLFQCVICGVSVKYKREHLNKKHQITEDVYDELIERKNRGEDISEVLPEREVRKCHICDRDVLDMRKHLERSHQMTEDLYEEMVSNGEIAVSGAELKGEGEESPSAAISPPILLPRSITTTRVKTEANSATDLHCPFNCAEAFKKDYQVHLHLKLKHRNEPEDVLKKAYDAVDEEIELTKRSASIYHCALCDKQFSDNFYSHISTKHGMQWKEYKDKFGRCEVESANFECSICSRVVKHDRNTVHTHLKNVHGINWQIYMERMRKLKKGEEPDELPQIETTLCQVCNVSVKYLKEHLRNAHKITEQEYETLFESESQEQPSGSSASGLGFGSRISISRIPRQQQLQDPTLAEPEAETQFEDPPPKPPKSDIHDKTNKRCSSCNIAFDSRRSFIEHCTTVHSMKFKTKSGITISAPTLTNANYINRSIIKQEQVDDGSQHHPVLVPPPPPLLKRGAAVGPPDMTAVAKKPKTILTNEGNLEVEAAYAHSGPHLGPQYTSSGVSKWNQCRYECCFCKKTTMSRSSMTSHINNSHGISIQDYKKANYPDIEVETNWFKCRLCPTRTKFVKDCVAPHLKMSHSMEIETYEEQFMLPEDWPAAAAHKLATKSSYVGPGQFRQKLQSQQDNSNDGSHPLTSREMAVIAVKEDKWNKCKFQCCLCDWVSIDSRQMRSHIAAQHSLAYDKYVQQYGSAEVVTKKFRCDLCNSVFKHCRQNIYAHMKDVHKISLQEYEDRAGISEVDDQQQVDEQQQDDMWPVGQDDEADVAAGPSLSDWLHVGHIPSRWNRCRFQCYLCKKMSSEKRHIREHIIKHHDLSMQDYESNYGDCEMHTEYFFCGVCHAEVKHNLKNISLHLQNVHNMTPQAYEDQFGRLAEDDAVVGEAAAVVPDDVGDNFTDDQGDGGEYGDYSASHFLTIDAATLEDGYEGDVGVAEGGLPLTMPPEEDIKNPRCKLCRACNRDFNRRQAFVEHCRNIHGMKISFHSNGGVQIAGGNVTPVTTFVPPPPRPLVQVRSKPITETGQGYPCDFCGKVFSNRSNRNRHKILSCEIRRDQLQSDNGKGTMEQSMMEMTDDLEEGSEQMDGEKEGTRKPQEKEAKCPYPNCEVTQVRSALMKRHLYEAHKIKNVTVALPKIKMEPVDEEATNGYQEHYASSSDDERKVPPLRVVLNGSSAKVRSDSEGSVRAIPVTPSKEFKQCAHCAFQSKNLYILDRHQKACLKRKKNLEAVAAACEESDCEKAKPTDEAENEEVVREPGSDDKESGRTGEGANGELASEAESGNIGENEVVNGGDTGDEPMETADEDSEAAVEDSGEMVEETVTAEAGGEELSETAADLSQTDGTDPDESADGDQERDVADPEESAGKTEEVSNDPQDSAVEVATEKKGVSEKDNPEKDVETHLPPEVGEVEKEQQELDSQS